ncbi:MAG: DUF1648 domain-containing protein [Hyphomicrobiales bacterium]
MTGSFDTKSNQEKGGYWANRLAAFLFLSSVITLFFVPFNTQVPTKWTFSGEPSQFVSAWMALLIMPVVVIIFSICMHKWQSWYGNTPTERRHVIVVGILGAIILVLCHGMIIWGALARA